VRTRGQPFRGGARGGFRVGGLQGDHPERLVPGDQLRSGDPGAAHVD